MKSHVVLGGHVDRGPKPDVVEFPEVLAQSLARHAFATVIGDAGYESERARVRSTNVRPKRRAHVLCREELGVESIFPTTVRGKKRKDGRRVAQGIFRTNVSAGPRSVAVRRLTFKPSA